MAAAMALQAAAVIEPEHHYRCLGFRARQCLDRDLGQRRERAPGARHQLAEIVAGHVLHHPAAGLEGLAPPRYRRETEEVVARGASLDPARARHVGGKDTADGAAPGGTAKQRAIVHGLESELLTLRFHQRLDLGNRRPCPRRQHQFLRLVKRDARQRGEIERHVGLRGPADRTLRAMANDFQRLAFGNRPAHGVFDVLAVARFERVGHCAPRLAPALRTASAS